MFKFLLIAMLISSSAFAEDSTMGNFLTSTSLFYNSSVRSRSSKESSSTFIYDVRLGYSVYPGLYVGGIYQSELDSSKNSGYSDSSLNVSSKSERASYGPTIAYFYDQMTFALSYFFESNWKLRSTDSSSSDTYKYAGSGYQLDVGYRIPLWGGFIGPQLSYKYFKYNKLDTNGAGQVSITPTLEETNFDPALVFVFFF